MHVNSVDQHLQVLALLQAFLVSELAFVSVEVDPEVVNCGFMGGQPKLFQELSLSVVHLSIVQVRITLSVVGLLHLQSLNELFVEVLVAVDIVDVSLEVEQSQG